MLIPKSSHRLRNHLLPVAAISLALVLSPVASARSVKLIGYLKDDTAHGSANKSGSGINIAIRPATEETKQTSERAPVRADEAGATADNIDQVSEDDAAEARATEQALAKQRAELTAWSHFDLAHHYESRFDLELADTEFEQAILYMPDFKVAHRDYCLLSIARLNLAKAVAEFMLATGLGEPVPYTPFEKAELDARAAKLHYRKALSYGRSSRWPIAITELKWALTYSPENPAIKRSLAFAYASSGQFEEAERQYAGSFEADPNDAYSHADFAFLLSEEGKSTNAINQMSKAVELEPQVAALHVDLAWFSEKNGDRAKACKELQEAVKLSPKHAVLWAHLGRLAQELGDTSQSKKAYAAALALDPQLAEAKEALSKPNNANN